MYRREVCAEVARRGIDEETLAIRVLDLDVGSGSSGRVVALMGFFESFPIDAGEETTVAALGLAAKATTSVEGRCQRVSGESSEDCDVQHRKIVVKIFGKDCGEVK